jgi:hypothetical protein
VKAILRRFFVENWRAKLMSLIVASAVWYVIKKNITTGPGAWAEDRRQPVPERRDR